MIRTSVELLVFMLLWWSSCTAMGDYVKYKDPSQLVAVRVEDLLSRMTLEEKIGQMVQIDRTVATPDIMRNYYIGNSHTLTHLINSENAISRARFAFAKANYASMFCTLYLQDTAELCISPFLLWLQHVNMLVCIVYNLISVQRLRRKSLFKIFKSKLHQCALNYGRSSNLVAKL